MTDPKRLKVTKSAKKAELLDRTISERKFCSVCQYYYSEMFTCPICYGAEQERKRIIKLLEAWLADDYADFIDTLELIKDKQKAEESNETEN